MTELWTVLTLVGYLLTLLLLPWVLLTKSRYPVSTIVWIMTIAFLPYLGGLLFLVFGVNRVKRIDRRRFGKTQASRIIDRGLSYLAPHLRIPGDLQEPLQERLTRLARRVGGTEAVLGNRIEILTDTNRTLGLMEQAIRAATETIHLEYYIWQPDRTGTRLRDLLVEKAREGVKIRFLYDGLGSMRLTRKFMRPMIEAGIRVASFLPGATFRERWSINLRSHRKIVVVDGRVGFTGGMNVGDEYHGRDPALGFWRDTHLRLTGPTVLQLQQVFAEDWFYATNEELTSPELYPTETDSGGVTAQVIASGPTEDLSSMYAVMFAAINEARDRITLTTSYFVPTPPLQTALEVAAYRGVRVRLLLSGGQDYYWTHLAGRSFYDSLLDAGVEISEYQGGLLHSKTLAIDGEWCLVGSANFDARSLRLNFEVGVAMYDRRLAEQLEERFELDLQRARRIDPEEWERRSLRERLAESVFRLFAPVF